MHWVWEPWECKYYLVFAPKYRRQIIYGKLKVEVGKILRDMCERKGIEIRLYNKYGGDKIIKKYIKNIVQNN